jgi:hypothetical protein
MARDRRELDAHEEDADAPRTTRTSCDQESFDVVSDLLGRDPMRRTTHEHVCDTNEGATLRARERTTCEHAWEDAVRDIAE